MKTTTHAQRYSVLVALLLAGVLLFAAMPTSAASPTKFRLQDIDGEWFDLSDHLGKEVIYISFWATWCSPCRRELPHLEKMYQELGDQGFLVVSVNTDPVATKRKIKPYVKRHKFTFPVVLDPDNNVHEKYNPTRELPFAILVDSEGNIHETYAGYRSGDEIFLREEVGKLLKGEAANAEE